MFTNTESTFRERSTIFILEFIIDPDERKSYPSMYACILGAQKNRLIETVLLSIHNVCFRWEIEEICFQYALLSGSRIYGLPALNIY